MVYLRLFVKVKPYSFRLLFQGNVLAFRLLIINENSGVAHASPSLGQCIIFFIIFKPYQDLMKDIIVLRA